MNITIYVDHKFIFLISFIPDQCIYKTFIIAYLCDIELNNIILI